MWVYVRMPELTDPEKNIIEPIVSYNDGLNSFLAGQWVQEIKKTGILAFLIPGAQLSSTVVLHNGVVPENFYEAVRFWSIFVYFEVPRWEENANNTKYLFTQPVLSFVSSRSRRLAAISEVSQTWRF